jgi:hypothetical protein
VCMRAGASRERQRERKVEVSDRFSTHFSPPPPPPTTLLTSIRACLPLSRRLRVNGVVPRLPSKPEHPAPCTDVAERIRAPASSLIRPRNLPLSNKCTHYDVDAYIIVMVYQWEPAAGTDICSFPRSHNVMSC